MRNILKNYKIFNLDPIKLRSKNFYKKTVDYDTHVFNKFKKAILTPSQFKCFLCGNTKGDKFLIYKKTYELLECKKCGAVCPSIDFSKIDMAELNDDEKANDNIKKQVYATYDYRKKNYATERLNYLLEKTGLSKTDAKVLDVGCGPGYFISHLKDKKIINKGLEVSDFLVGMCKEMGLNADSNDLSEEPENYYNAITLFDVIEHLENPVSFFKTLNAKLDKRGYVLAYTPNIHSVAFMLMGERQNLLRPFLHLCFYDNRSLDYLAKKTGFEVASIDYYGLDLMDYLFMKQYDDKFNYPAKMKEFIPVMQAIIDNQKLSNHMRIVFKKIKEV
ncbi:MAG: hypothetical protein COV29_02190 [Candidatus Yanofskybacteria bacterium CG10_big_fil_rev_8_21_14_0_10_36_16]|uniref:Methyltransferase type 12 n=1 Tax=Candidatus Yanofskybacteria bacterium CG10_big_fil_rev_8_21_14_0_10_36_16 TaxID=1975096 RepID=A0A2J0Q7K5_9BACT|nr:MAG: hypothetical protein COV29_02190 [Candidatus Yanofskybacteria bacterium CG10_big_fil_rev_8_21_14_0_10_36_16]